jgi:hypothetical protein
MVSPGRSCLILISKTGANMSGERGWACWVPGMRAWRVSRFRIAAGCDWIFANEEWIICVPTGLELLCPRSVPEWRWMS